MNKRGATYLFLLLFMLMIVFLSKLDNFQKNEANGKDFLYLQTDTSGYHDQHTDIVRQDIFVKIFFTPKKRPLLKVSTRIFVKHNDYKDSLILNSSGLFHISKVSSAKSGVRINSSGVKIPLSLPYEVILIDYAVRPGIYHEWIQGLVVEEELREEKPVYWINSIAPPFGTRTWLLCKDTPYDKIDTLDIKIQVPANYQAISNGELVRKMVVKDSLIFYYRTTYPTATYLIAFNAGPYQKFSFTYSSSGKGISYPIDLYFKNLPDDHSLKSIKERIEDILKFYESLLGPYPFHEEGLKIVKANFHGGMENQTVIGVEEISLEKEYLIAHEIAHQWFGNKITPDFHDSWLSEGFATYFTALYRKYKEGEISFAQYMAERKVLQEKSVHVNNIIVPDSVYDFSKVYAKASWCVFQIHQYLGDRKFFQRLNHWLNRDVHTPVHFSDFLLTFFPDSSDALLKLWLRKLILKGLLPEMKGKITQKGDKFYIELQQINSDFPVFPLFWKQDKNMRKLLVKADDKIVLGPCSSIEECINALSSNLMKIQYIYP